MIKSGLELITEAKIAETRSFSIREAAESESDDQGFHMKEFPKLMEVIGPLKASELTIVTSHTGQGKSNFARNLGGEVYLY